MDTSLVPILADATAVPHRSNSIDVVLCVNVSHHLTDALLERLLTESMRVLKTSGTFLFFDAVWQPRRLGGRLLWKCDRGRYPRTVEHLRGMILNYYHISYQQSLFIVHEYFMCVGVKGTLSNS